MLVRNGRPAARPRAAAAPGSGRARPGRLGATVLRRRPAEGAGARGEGGGGTSREFPLRGRGAEGVASTVATAAAAAAGALVRPVQFPGSPDRPSPVRSPPCFEFQLSERGRVAAWPGQARPEGFKARYQIMTVQDPIVVWPFI